MARLQVEFRGTKTVVSLKHVKTTVGRSNRCTIHLPDPALAEVHFRIEHKSRGYRLKDDGSGVGTHVNGKPVFATTLDHGDVIEAGGLRCVFLEHAEAPSEVERAPPPPPRKPPSRKPPSWLLPTAGGVIVLALAAFLLLRTSPEEKAGVLWEQAKAELDEARIDHADAEEHLRAAADLLEEIGVRYPRTRVALKAAVAADQARGTLEALGGLESERRHLDVALDEAGELEAFARLARLREARHPAVEARAQRLEEDLKQKRKQRLDALFFDAESRATALLRDKRFAEAARVWRELEIGDYFLRKRIDAAIEQVGKQASEAYRSLLRLASRSDDLSARIDLLEASRPVFLGTKHASDLEVRVSALRARRAQHEIVVLKDKPKPKPETTTPDDGGRPPETEEAGPYEEPPKVAALVKARRYGEAASTLHSITRHPGAKVRLEELKLLANLMADLVAAVSERPGEFRKILLPHGVGRGDAVGADTRHLKVKVEGEETQYAWESIPAKSYVRLFRIAGFEKPPRLATGLFFDEEELPKEAQKNYVAFYRSEQAREMLYRVLARRRGIETPSGGFVLFRGQLITPAEQETILLKEKIDKLAKFGRSQTERRRREAWVELERIGEPAREVLATLLRERRSAAASELNSSRAFTASRFAARFGRQLEERRKEALAFIRDANKYPYPNKSEAAQKEAERLVDRVRELYETPFDDLLQSSDAAKALDGEVRELDTWLARIDPLAEPVHETVVESITKKLDMRTVAIDERDRKRIEYNLAVEKYNRELKATSADAEERGNVTAVNEYRWMMGLHSLKIDERLVRGARKHSIEMQQLNYFAHDSPTKHLRTPAQRAKREGYGGGVSENIARGAATGRQAFEQWFRSSGHHRNMVQGHTEMGCGSAAHHWWTQLFGRLTGKNLSPPDVPKDPDPPGQSGNGMPAPGRGS